MLLNLHLAIELRQQAAIIRAVRFDEVQPDQNLIGRSPVGVVPRVNDVRTTWRIPQEEFREVRLGQPRDRDRLLGSKLVRDTWCRAPTVAC